jgi:type I restriction enzyme, S subunit
VELKPGYKQTEVGMIPEDWEVMQLGEGVKLSSGQHILAKYCNIAGDGFAYITGPSDFPQGVIKHTKYTTRPGIICQKDDILITVKGSGVGTLARSDSEYCISRQLMAIQVERWNSEFIFFLLFRDVSFFSASATGLIPGISRDDIQKKFIPLPPSLLEQEAIAQALSDADALIESLEQLIAKKRQVKQGAMQELLTGKKRLEGFRSKMEFKDTEVGKIPEDWEVQLLPEICRFRGGKAHEQYISDSGKYVCVNSKFVSTDGQVRKYSTANFCPANRGDVLMVMSDLPNGRALAKTYLVEQDDLYAVNQRVCALTAYRDNSTYLSYVLNRNPYFLKFDNGVSQTHLLNGVFRSCPVKLPPLAEQNAIATTLSDMDAEIVMLETKLEKARQVKQGMMHNLLTGRIRLV